MKFLRLAVLVVAGLVLSHPTASRAQNNEPFYDDKTIRIVVGLSPGGGDDRVARSIAKIMPKYIPGQPDVIVQNTPGARSLLAAPGTPADRVKILRDAYERTMNDPELLAEAKKLRFEMEPSRGDELQARALEVLNQPREVVERIKKIFVP